MTKVVVNELAFRKIAEESFNWAMAFYDLGLAIAPSMVREFVKSGILISPNPFMYSAIPHQKNQRNGR